MALKLEDPSNGFHHGRVVAFINERMARHEKGSAFCLENIYLSWAEVEDKLRAMLEDCQVPSEAKEACVWGNLALGVRFTHRQTQLHKHRVQWLHDFAKLHKSAVQASVSDLKLLQAQQELERKEAAFLLQLAHASLAEVQEERDLLRRKLLQEEPRAKGPGLAAASGTGTEGAGEEEEEAGATAPPAAASGATEGGGRQKDVEGPEAAEGEEELCGDLMQLLGIGNEKNYPSGGHREGGLRSCGTPTLRYLSGIAKPRSTASREPRPVQLTASFPSAHSLPLFLFPDVPMSSPPAAPFTEGAPSRTSPGWGPSDSSLRSNVGRGSGNGPSRTTKRWEGPWSPPAEETSSTSKARGLGLPLE
ncbi:LOW QUALITY PROTEIN: testis-expressed protein 13B [Kogia breviceps]|uniref:LOW QUALITY PROTEIN: testis-expressed protein 13B n=1 Tax=Kogia breviceps TaxID=27615 RepID=UPI0034D3803C